MSFAKGSDSKFRGKNKVKIEAQLKTKRAPRVHEAGTCYQEWQTLTNVDDIVMQVDIDRVAKAYERTKSYGRLQQTKMDVDGQTDGRALVMALLQTGRCRLSNVKLTRKHE